MSLFNRRKLEKMQKRAEALLIVIGRHEWWWLENPCGITNPPEHQLLFWFPQR
jgi:hypothetical protein